MGRPPLKSDLPRYASRFRDRHGKERIRFRRTGWESRYAEHKPGTAEFTEEYHKWRENAKAERPSRVKELLKHFGSVAQSLRPQAETAARTPFAR